jgi:phosphatidylethanolamine/phosphatidyl-N-methylethanolamine N-methyltransferase
MNLKTVNTTCTSQSRRTLLDCLLFLAAFVRQPGQIGALFPSSRSLATAMIQPLDLRHAETVVELGPGTGAFTRLLVDQLPQSALCLALEVDSARSRVLQSRFQRVIVYNRSAEALGACLRRHGRRKADCIISGLPWASMNLCAQSRILEAIFANIQSYGMLTTFGYLHCRDFPNAVNMRRILRSRFATFQPSQIIWKNVPPAIVYTCSSIHPK